MPYLDIILHHLFQSSSLESAHTALSVVATFEMHSGNVSLFGCLVPSALTLEGSQLHQIVSPSS
jgi:hypothetical protein